MGNTRKPDDGGVDEETPAPRAQAPSQGPIDITPGENAAARVGTILRDKWRLDALLGTGGHAAVYAASHMNNGKRAAVKVLHPELSARADLVRRMLREGFFANQISHASAVSVLDDDRADDGSVYLVMDLLEGHSLDRYVGAEERLPPGEVLRVTEQVLGFLVEAHAAGILHRDIKPANLFLTNEGHVKVLDFGIARLTESSSDSSSTQTDTKLGTPAYMPPEQARGRWNMLDGRSDVWALGATMYALLTGKKPREAETSNEELLLAMTEPLPSLAGLVKRLPLSVVDLVDRAVAFEMSDRWPDARAMQKALRVAKIAVDDDDDGELTERREPSNLPPPMPPAPPRAAGSPPAPPPAPSRPPARAVPVPPPRKPVSVPPRAISVPPPPVRGAALPAPPVRKAGRLVSAPPPPPARGAALPAPPVRPTPRAPAASPQPPPSNPADHSSVSGVTGAAFSTPVNLLSLAHLPNMGFILLGAHHPEGEPARLRAYDPRRRAIVWEALEGEDWLEYLKDIRILGRWVLIPNRTMLHCLDLGTGKLLWTAKLTEKVDLIGGGPHRGPAVYEAGGALVAKTIGRTLLSLDPATGQEKARRKFDGNVDLLAVDGDPSVVVRFDQADRGLMEIMNPSTLELAGRFGKAWFLGDESSVLAASSAGTHIVAHVESWGLLSSRGVLVGEVATRKEALFERDRNVDQDVVPAFADGRLVYATTKGDIHAPGGKKVGLPLAGHRVKAVLLAGATLFVALEDTSGVVQLVALDAATLAPKLQYGALAQMGQAARVSKRDPARYVVAEGGLAFFVARRDGSTYGELRIVDVSTGAIVSTRSLSDVGVLDDWYVQAGCLVLWSQSAVRVIDPTRGITVVSYTGA